MADLFYDEQGNAYTMVPTPQGMQPVLTNPATQDLPARGARVATERALETLSFGLLDPGLATPAEEAIFQGTPAAALGVGAGATINPVGPGLTAARMAFPAVRGAIGGARVAERARGAIQGAAARFRPGPQSRVGQQFAAASEANPVMNVITGVGRRKAANQRLLNDTAARSVGITQTTGKLTPAMLRQRRGELSEVFERELGKVGNVNVAPGKANAQAIVDDLAEFPDLQKQLQAMVNKVPDDVVDGKTLFGRTSKWRGDARRMKGSDPQRSYYTDKIAREVENEIFENMDSTLALREAQQNWKMLLEMEKRVTGGGDVTARILEKSLRRGNMSTADQLELRDLAEVAAENADFIGDSGTATRQFFNWMFGAAAALGGGAIAGAQF